MKTSQVKQISWWLTLKKITNMQNVTVTTKKDWRKYQETGDDKFLKQPFNTDDDLVLSGEGWSYDIKII